jgi:hypothetical protein
VPLETEVLRNGRRRRDIKWQGFHVAAMIIAAALDSGKGPWEDNTQEGVFGDRVPGYPSEPAPITRSDIWQLVSYPVIATTPLGRGSYVLKNDHRFMFEGTLFELRAGDELRTARVSK